MDECFGLGGGAVAAEEGSLYESKMVSKEGGGDGVDLVGAGADAAGAKRSSYKGAEGAAAEAGEADLVLVQADPAGPEDRAADIGAAFPCGRRPKSRVSRPWKSSMPGPTAGGSVDLAIRHAAEVASTAPRSAKGGAGGGGAGSGTGRIRAGPGWG